MILLLDPSGLAVISSVGRAVGSDRSVTVELTPQSKEEFGR